MTNVKSTSHFMVKMPIKRHTTDMFFTLYIIFATFPGILAQETVRKNMRFYRFYVLLIAN